MKTNRHNILEKIKHIRLEIEELDDMERKYTQEQEHKCQKTLNLGGTPLTLFPSRSWGEYLLERWPQPEDFTLYLKTHSQKEIKDIYQHIVGKKALWEQIQDETYRAYQCRIIK